MPRGKGWILQTAELRGLELERRKRQADVFLAALAKSGKTLDDVLTFLGR